MIASVTAERIADTPPAADPERAAAFLERCEAATLEDQIRIPLATLGIPLAGAITHPVALSFGIHGDLTEAVRSHEAIRFTWRTGTPLLPDFNGTLRFCSAPRDRTQLVFSGTYRPPFGPLGALFDRLFGRRAARATARDLLARIADELERGERAYRATHPTLA